MRPFVEHTLRTATALSVAAGGVCLVTAPALAPAVVLPGLFLAARPLFRAWRRADGTALRPAVIWAAVSIALGVAAEGFALGEPLATGRPAAGHLAYLACLAALSATISVLNARTPGGGAWAVLMVLMVVVFLIPWLEGPGLGHGPDRLARLRLDSPWTIFYGLLVVAGVTNYLPTRYGPAAALVGLGFLLEYLGLTRWVTSPSGRAVLWAAVPWSFAAAVATADLRARRERPGACRAEAVWFWFRDHWGAVWGLRLLERFNRSAEAQDWPVRLAWHGLVPAPGAAAGGGPVPPTPPEAAVVLEGLLRRFASAPRLGGVGAPATSPLAIGKRPLDDA